MDKKYIGICPICRGYGMLEIGYNLDEKKCIVICDECFAQWNSPEESLIKENGRRDYSNKYEVRLATDDEIRMAGWEKYITK